MRDRAHVGSRRSGKGATEESIVTNWLTWRVKSSLHHRVGWREEDKLHFTAHGSSDGVRIKDKLVVLPYCDGLDTNRRGCSGCWCGG